MDGLDALIGELSATAQSTAPLLDTSSRVEDWMKRFPRSLDLQRHAHEPRLANRVELVS